MVKKLFSHLILLGLNCHLFPVSGDSVFQMFEAAIQKVGSKSSLYKESMTSRSPTISSRLQAFTSTASKDL